MPEIPDRRIYKETNNTDILGFTVENTSFNFAVNDSNLCTQWEVYSLENDAAQNACYGSAACCNFIGFSSERESWGDIFYLNKNKLGATKNNIVSAKVVNFDYSTDTSNIYSRIYYSDLYSAKAVFDEGVIEFEDVCVETCEGLNNFDNLFYKIDILGNGRIDLVNVTYNVLTNVGTEKLLPDLAPCTKNEECLYLFCDVGNSDVCAG